MLNNRKKEESATATTYNYEISDISKTEMLGYICDVLNGNNVVNHGCVITQPSQSEEWSGVPMQLPVMPDKTEFVPSYKDMPITCITAILEYKGQTLMVAYKPNEDVFSIIFPKDNTIDIDEIEKEIIPDQIDHNPKL